MPIDVTAPLGREKTNLAISGRLRQCASAVDRVNRMGLHVLALDPLAETPLIVVSADATALERHPWEYLGMKVGSPLEETYGMTIGDGVRVLMRRAVPCAEHLRRAA